MIVRGVEMPAEDRRHAENRKQVPGDRRTLQALRLHAFGQRQRSSAQRDNCLEGGRALLEVDEIGIRHAGVTNAAALGGLVQDQQPIGLGVGQRLDQDAVDDAEERGVDADAEREAEDDDGRDTGVVHEAADGVADVAEGHGG